MKVSELISFVDAIKPNAFPVSAKVAWLNEVEGMVWTEVMLLSPLEFVPHTYDDSTGEGDADLLVVPPHSKLYNTYLCAMIDFSNGEYDKYQNTMTLFNAHFSEFMRWYATHYRPADGNCSYMGIYISAYGIAVKHGYTGTEEEWLASLKGNDGERGEPFTYDDFTEEQLAALIGPPGLTVTKAAVNAEWHLIISLSDGTTIDAGYVRGGQGEPFTYDDFTEEQLAALIGPPGENGSGIDRIEIISGTGAAGEIDTYAVYLEDGIVAGTFTVYNGKDGENSEGGGVLEETDPTVPDWAKEPNKPTYTASEIGALPDTTYIPKNTSDLANDSGFVTKAVSDLANYYTKSQTLSAAEINAKISAIPKFAISVVSSLPASNISATTIYLVGGGSGSDLYTEYIYTEGAWEILGSQKVDLTGYAKEAWVTAQLEDCLKEGELDAAINTALAEAKASGEFDGADGKDAPSISYAEITPDGDLYLYLTDGEVLPAGHVRGEDGYTPVKGKDYFDGAAGNDGVTYTPSVSEDGIIGWTNNGGLPNPEPVNIMGPAGTDGKTPVKGTDYFTEADKAEIAAVAAGLVDTSGLVAKNQGAANAGKILVVGTDGNLTLADMPEGGASGDVIGILDDSNNILLTGALADGTYTLKYENADGSYTEIGSLVVGEVVTARLPAEYQEVEWVQIIDAENNDINSCVHTGIPWNTANKIVAKIQNVTSSNARDIIMSAWSSQTVKATPYIATRTDKTPAALYNYPSGLTGYAVSPSSIAFTDLNANEVTFTFTATSTADICFGGWYDNSYSHPHKWYYMEVYNGDTLLGNFIPCYRVADNVNGFYDLVGGKFYNNAGPDYSGVTEFLYRGDDV